MVDMSLYTPGYWTCNPLDGVTLADPFLAIESSDWEAAESPMKRTVEKNCFNDSSIAKLDGVAEKE